jgi:hypothetical protein
LQIINLSSIGCVVGGIGWATMAIYKSFDWSDEAGATQSCVGPTVALSERAITVLGQQGFVILCGTGFSFDSRTKIKSGTITSVYSYLTRLRSTDSVDELLECVSNISVPLAQAQTIPCVQDFLDKDAALKKLIPVESEIPPFPIYSSAPPNLSRAHEFPGTGGKSEPPFLWQKWLPKGLFARDVFWIDLAIVLLVVGMAEALYFTSHIFGFSFALMISDKI